MKIVFILMLIGNGSGSHVGTRLAVYEKYDQCQKVASVVQSKSMFIDVFCIPANG